jgi:hypothetical protein
MRRSLCCQFNPYSLILEIYLSGLRNYCGQNAVFSLNLIIIDYQNEWFHSVDL